MIILKENTPIPIERGGGKLEGVRALEEAGFPVPKSRYLYHEDLANPRLLQACLADLAKPLIVRGSHPNDWHGYIDVLPTYKNIRSDTDLEKAVRAIQRVAGSEALRLHAQDWGQPFSTEVHVLVQEQSPSPIAGSILRHPHISGQIDMNFVDRDKHQNEGGDFKSHPLFSKARRRDYDGGLDLTTFELAITNEEVERAMAVYADVENSGLLDTDWVYQMEFGFDPFLIYQLRPFKRREPVQTFAIPKPSELNGPYISSDLTFGITPAEGIRIGLTALEFVDLYCGGFRPPQEKYGLLLTDLTQESLHPQIPLGNLTVFYAKRGTTGYLEHGDYRLLKKAEYSSCDYYAWDVTNDGRRFRGPEDFKVFADAHYWSNGEESILVPAGYAS